MSKKQLTLHDATEEVAKMMGADFTPEQLKAASSWFVAGALWVTRHHMDKRKKPFNKPKTKQS